METSGTAAEAPLTSLKAAVDARGGYWLADRWLAELGLQFNQRALIDGSYTEQEQKFGWDPTLWSGYQEDHQRALRPELSLRWVAARWLWLSALGMLNTNQDFTSLDYARAEGRIDWGGPRWSVRVAGRLEERFAGPGRPTPFANPAVLAGGHVTFWPASGVALQPGVQAIYEPHSGTVSMLAGVTMYWSGDRGLDDVRPSRLGFKDAAEWHRQDGPATGAGAEPRDQTAQPAQTASRKLASDDRATSPQGRP